MLFSPRMSLKQLAGFSQRAAMALLAGIDERTICAREAQIARVPPDGVWPTSAKRSTAAVRSARRWPTTTSFPRFSAKWSSWASSRADSRIRFEGTS